jgi:hypothetical protein
LRRTAGRRDQLAGLKAWGGRAESGLIRAVESQTTTWRQSVKLLITWRQEPQARG